MSIINIMAMAGKGKRFLDAKYIEPKPLLKIKNNHMFIQASKSFSRKNKFIFICNENLKSYPNIYKIFKRNFNNYRILFLKRTTKGQAITCYKSLDYINDNEIINFLACDSSFKFNKLEYKKKIQKNDLIIYVTKPSDNELKKVKSYGWVSYSNKIKKISCKMAASSSPENDYLIIGSFTYKNKKVFKKCFNFMKKKQMIVNNEYYMDTMAMIALKLKYKVDVIIVNKYINMGDPQSLEMIK